MPIAIIVFFVAHYSASIFMQSFFMHRYASHRMFTMSKGWEKFFHLLAYVSMGASYLVPSAYAILHRQHHAFSDTERDPHSPRMYPNPFTLMLHTKHRYDAYAKGRELPEERFMGGYPEWKTLDRMSQSWFVRMAWVAFYTLFYVHFATAWWQFLLLPAHFLMGPMHGVMVNWWGHRFGYKTFDNGDVSRNTLPVDVLTMGELYQNNHHKYAMSPNFAVRWFELDLCYQGIRVLALLRIISFLPHRQVALAPAE